MGSNFLTRDLTWAPGMRSAESATGPPKKSPNILYYSFFFLLKTLHSSCGCANFSLKFYLLFLHLLTHGILSACAFCKSIRQGSLLKCSSVTQSCLFATPLTIARQASLCFTISRSLLKLKSIELVIPSNLLILCHPLLFPSTFPSIRVFSKRHS